MLLAAGPLLVTSITLAPFAVAAALLAQRLPWLLFGLLAGEVVDRVDRRRLMVVAHLARAAVLGGLVVAVVVDGLSLPIVYGTMFLLGSAETFADNAGAWQFPRLEQRFSYTALLRAGLVVETCTHLVLAATTSWTVAAVILAAFGVHEAVWGSLSTTIRLRATPDHLLGRVNSVYLLGVLAPMSVGALLGGWIATQFGVVAVLWYGGAGAALTTAWAWRGLADLGRYDPAAPEPAPVA